MLHFGEIRKKFGENLARFNKKFSKILVNFAKILKKSAKFKCQQFLTKKLRLENGFFASGFQNGAKECIV